MGEWPDETFGLRWWWEEGRVPPLYKDKISYYALHEITFHFDGMSQFHIYLLGDTFLSPREGFRGDGSTTYCPPVLPTVMSRLDGNGGGKSVGGKSLKTGTASRTHDLPILFATLPRTVTPKNRGRAPSSHPSIHPSLEQTSKKLTL